MIQCQKKNSVKILVLTQDTWRTMKKGLFRLENIFRAQLPAATRKGTEKRKRTPVKGLKLRDKLIQETGH